MESLINAICFHVGTLYLNLVTFFKSFNVVVIVVGSSVGEVVLESVFDIIVSFLIPAHRGFRDNRYI